MANTYLPGDILAMTAGAAERLMRAGNGDAALLYLWLLKNNGVYQNIRAAQALHWNAERCTGAFTTLVTLGLMDEAKVQSSLLFPGEPPNYSLEDITREITDHSSTFFPLFQEVQRRLGKILSPAELKSLYTIHDFLALPAEVTLLVVSWCIQECERKYGEGHRPRLSQIQQEAARWREQGIDTLEAAEAHVKQLNLLRNRTTQVMAIFNLQGRPAIGRERAYIETWVNMSFDNEAIRLAYERTMLQKHSLNWNYMNSILCDWHRKGLHTTTEINAGDPPLRVRKDNVALGATAPQPLPPGEAAQQTEEDMEWVRKFLQQQSEGEVSYGI